MDKEQEKLNQPVTLKVLGEFTDQVLLPAIERMMDKKLENHPTKEDLSKHATKEDLNKYPTKVELYEVLKNYATKADLEEHKDEIIKAIRGKMENVVQHQTVATDVIERQGCAKPEELKILKESVT